MPIIYKIARQTDQEMIAALGRVRLAVKLFVNLDLRVTIPRGNEISLPEQDPEKFQGLAFVFEQGSQILDYVNLRGPQNISILTVRRTFDKVIDDVTIEDSWPNHLPENIRSQAWVAFLSNVRKELKANDVEAAFQGSEDSAWNRYRNAQTAVINSLQNALETLLIKTADKNSELDRARSARFEQLEKDLRQEISEERKKLQAEFEGKEKALSEQTKELTDREASFNTKEARYVARKKQEEQIEQVKNWLSDWKLTQGTTEKRRGVFWAYSSALLVTGCLTAYATYHNYQLLTSADDIAKLQWWHWLAIISKSFFPLAAFTTFMIYFIRWSSAWARQHADEEFINRTRLIDIGRAAWLLEAVRDAQERNKEIPQELLKELSRNLFAHTASNEGDVQPETAADILLQGLSSLRVKSADGTEMEAKRGK